MSSTNELGFSPEYAEDLAQAERNAEARRQHDRFEQPQSLRRKSPTPSWHAPWRQGVHRE